MKSLNYSSEIMEKFAIRIISNSFDYSYSEYIWHDKDDDFDFTSPDDMTALEIATIISRNTQNAIQYEKALGNGKKPDVSKVRNAHIDKNGELLIYYGGSMCETINDIVATINKKEAKRVKRTKKYNRYELCLCIDEGGIFNTPNDFDFLIENSYLSSTGFSRLFLIMSSNFYAIENNTIKEYERVLK